MPTSASIPPRTSPRSAAPPPPAPSRAPRLTRFAAALALGLSIALFSLLLLRPDSVPGMSLARASYDLSFRLRPAPDLNGSGGSPLVVVYLDRRSFEVLGRNPAEPLDRTYHARLIHRLHEAGASLILFDILFDQPASDPTSDAALAEAIRAHGRVLLGAEWHRAERAMADASSLAIRQVSLPVSPLLEAAAGHGFAFLRVDPDFVVRRQFPGFLDREMPSLTWQAARHLDLPVTRDVPPPGQTRWLNYYGPPFTLPNVNYADALDPAATPDALFRGKVVLVGTRPTAGRFDERRDEWRNPVARWGQGSPYMPGAEVHGTELLNYLRGDWLQRPSAGAEALALGISALLLAFLFVSLRPAPAAAAVLGAELGVLLVASVLLGNQRLWFPWLIPAAIQIPAAATGSFVLHSVSWYRQRKRFLSRIREQAALLDKAQDAILVANLDGRVTYANPRAMDLYGWTAQSLDSPAPPHLQAGGAAPGEGLDAAFAGARTRGEWSGELQQHNARGEPIVVESRATLIRDLHAQPHQVLFINTDITERKRLQDQFLRAQRRESIGALAGGMAHDLNNALSPILMGIQMLKARAGDDAMRRMLAIMESNTQRGAGMVRQVLLFSRGQEAVTGPVHLPALLRELEAVLRQSFPPAIEITVLAPADLWTIQGNPTQLQQILLNLCLNARDAMPSGGRLTLAGDNADLTADELADLPNLRPGRHLMLLVSDTGTGIPPEIQARLFEPFFTTKPPGIGTGLGLATVASLVKGHGGSLRVRSTPGEGTTFEIYLPAASAEAATSTAPDTAAPAAVRGRGQKILVVDDEISVREMLCEGLTAQGYAVLAASSELEALALARQHREDLRLVITDWRLPVLGGEGLAGQLRAERPDLPLLIVSGTLSHAPELPALPGAPPLVLAKPFRFEDLLARIEQALADPA